MSWSAQKLDRIAIEHRQDAKHLAGSGPTVEIMNFAFSGSNIYVKYD